VGSDRARLPVALAVIREFHLPIALALALMAACFVASTSRRWRFAALLVLALVWNTGLTAFGTYPLALRITPRARAEHLGARLGPHDQLCARGALDHAFRYYVGRPVRRCSEMADAPARTFVIRQVASERSGRSRYKLTRYHREAPRQPRVVEPERGGADAVEGPISYGARPSACTGTLDFAHAARGGAA
jgi:hypothetical protein